MNAGTGTGPGVTSAADAAGSPSQEIPFKTSVMLWTVLTELPFDQRLEKMAEAGYRAVELSGEYANWTDDDFRRSQIGNQRPQALGHARTRPAYRHRSSMALQATPSTVQARFESDP